MPDTLIPSFNAGEISPYLDARSDLEKYASGCRTLENFIIMPYGGVFRRPGTEYLGTAKNANKRCRLIGFNFSTTTRFVIELGEASNGKGYIRFWSNGYQVTNPDGSPLEILDTPYLEGDLRDLQYVQINDVMYFTHPAHEPMKLSRVTDTSWTFAPIEWDWPAFLDENITATTITPAPASAPAWATAAAYTVGAFVTQTSVIYRCLVAHTSGTFSTDLAALKWEAVTSLKPDDVLTLTASAALFEAEHAGGYFQIAHARTNAATAVTGVTASTTSGGLCVLGSWDFTTYGTWAGTIQLQRASDPSGPWETFRTFTGNSDRNITSTGKQTKESWLRIVYTASSGTLTARLESVDAREYGVVKINTVTDSTHATATVINNIANSTATKIWAEGAWSTKRGFPRTVALHEQRLWFAGTKARPQSLWGSTVDDFENFRVSSVDDSGLFFTLSAQESNPIQWLLSQKSLFIGTAGDEWTLGSSDSNSTITPSNVKASREASYGSKYLRALIVNDVVLFVQRQGRKVRELLYSNQTESLVAQDLTLLSEHVTRGEILECAFQQQPDAIYWVITGEGQLVGLTYERLQNVVGWHRHTTDGAFESVATTYGANGADEVWVSVRRVINGQTVRYIERFRTDFRETFESEDKARWWYLDCARRVTNTPESATVTGLAHLEGKTVEILADGAASPERTVTSGAITLQAPATTVLAGLPFVSTLKPMRLEVTQYGTRGAKKRVHSLSIAVHKSLGGRFSTDGETFYDIYSRTTSDAMDASPPVFTGDKNIKTGAKSKESADIILQQEQPMPLTILAITPKWDFYAD